MNMGTMNMIQQQLQSLQPQPPQQPPAAAAPFSFNSMNAPPPSQPPAVTQGSKGADANKAVAMRLLQQLQARKKK